MTRPTAWCWGGAKQILLFNLPDLGQNPSARSQKVVEAASHVSAYHNQLLLNLARQLAPTGMVKLFEIDKQFAEMLREPQNFGLSDTENACYGGGYVWKPFSPAAPPPTADWPLQRAGEPRHRRQPCWPRPLPPHGAPQCG